MLIVIGHVVTTPETVERITQLCIEHSVRSRGEPGVGRDIRRFILDLDAGQAGGKVGGFQMICLLQSAIHHLWNRKESYLSREERRHGDFVGGIEYRRGATTGDHGFLSQSQHGKPRQINRAEIQGQ